MIPARIKTTAIPRPVPVPNHDPIALAPRQPSLISGMKINSAIGPINSAVIGMAIDSMLCAIPKTLPCFLYGTTFWRTVLSDASANGLQNIQIIIPEKIRIADGCIVKYIQVIHIHILTINIVLSGFFPSHFLAINIPAAINARLATANIIHRVCTGTSNSPYGSMSAINTHQRKLLNVVKKISANSHGISWMVAMVSLIFNFLLGACWSSVCAENMVFSGMVNVSRCPITSSIITAAHAIAQPIQRNQITNPLATDVRVNHTPLIVPILPFAFACSSLGKSSETVVDKAIVRKFPMIVPLISVTINSRNCRDVIVAKTAGSLLKYTIEPSIYAIADPILDRRITLCFL